MPKPPKPSDFSDFTPEFKPANKRFDKDSPDHQSDEEAKPFPKKKKKGEKSKYELLAEQFEGEQYKEDDWSEDSSNEAANDLKPKGDKKKKRKKKTPAKRQKEENAKHFEELQELKKKTEGEDYELPKPKKPERQEVKPSSAGDEDGKTPDSGKHNFDFNEEPDITKDDVSPQSAKDKPKKKKADADSSDDDSDEDSTASHKDQDENALMPDNSPRKKHEDEEGGEEDEDDPDLARLNRYEKALRDNENEKSRF